MQQSHLIPQTRQQALEDLIEALGGLQSVGVALRPKKGNGKANDPITAGRWLANAINPRKKDCLTWEDFWQLVIWGREKGCHVLVAKLNEDAGYAPPVPVTVDDQLADLHADLSSLVDLLQPKLAAAQRLLAKKSAS